VKLRFWIALGAELLLFGSLNFFDDWTLEWMPVRFVGCAILCGLAYLIAGTEFEAIKQNAGWIFWGATVALRLLALPLTPANEVWRFQADGVIQRAGLNPYQVAPNSSELSGKIPELARIPQNDTPTAFAPGAEALFRIIPATDNALAYKLIFGAADLLAIALLLRLLDKQTAAWLAWNPLIAYSFFGAAHFDSIVLLAIIALIFLSRAICASDIVALEICPWFRACAWSRDRLSTSLRRLARFNFLRLAPLLDCVNGRHCCPGRIRLRVSLFISAGSFWRFRSRQPAQRFILVADRRHNLTKLAPATLSLRCDYPHCLGGGCACSRSELATRPALVLGRGSYSRAGVTRMVFGLDFTDRDLAARFCLAFSGGNDFRVLPLL